MCCKVGESLAFVFVSLHYTKLSATEVKKIVWHIAAVLSRGRSRMTIYLIITIRIMKIVSDIIMIMITIIIMLKIIKHKDKSNNKQSEGILHEKKTLLKEILLYFRVLESKVRNLFCKVSHIKKIYAKCLCKIYTRPKQQWFGHFDIVFK